MMLGTALAGIAGHDDAGYSAGTMMWAKHARRH
jgi:hypothetical protein